MFFEVLKVRPSVLVTTKGVFQFHAETKELYLAQLHPGVSVEEVRKEIPWDLQVARPLAETPPPDAEEIDFIRRFAPAEVVGRSLRLELALLNLARKAKERLQS